MKLNTNFYIEIFEKETSWIEMIKDNLLNIYYLNGDGGITQFYKEKYEVLVNEYKKNNNEKLLFFINMIKDILDEINKLTEIYNSGQDISMDRLQSLFIVNQITK